MSSSKKKIAGWVISGLVAALLIGPSAIGGKFLAWEGKEEMFGKMGFTIDLMKKIGVLEVVIAGLYLIPRTSFVASILLVGYLGGAVVTHLRVGEPFFVPVIVGVLVWVGLGLRTPGVFSLAAGNTSVGSQGSANL